MRIIPSTCLLLTTIYAGSLSAHSADAVDITDVLFTDRAGSCDHYVGSYYSNVTDIKRAKNFTGDVIITSNGRTCTLRSNDIPNHDFNDSSAHFATNVSVQKLNFNIPAVPRQAYQPTPLALGTSEAVLLNGVVVDLLAAACYDAGREPKGREKMGCDHRYANHPWRYDPMSPLNDFGTDAHNAHTQPNGKYHYHGNPLAMFSTHCDNTRSASPLIGFAADGYPVYGSCIQDPSSGRIREVKSSYVLKDNGGPRRSVSGYSTPKAGTGVVASNHYDGQFRSDYQYAAGTGDLDECNGMTLNGQYGYYITNSFPWVMNCFKGQVDPSFTGREEQRGHGHPPGPPPGKGPPPGSNNATW